MSFSPTHRRFHKLQEAKPLIRSQMFFSRHETGRESGSILRGATLKNRTEHRADEHEANEVASSVANLKNWSRPISAIARNGLRLSTSNESAAPDMAAAVRPARSGGAALSPAHRAFYETQFGHDFSKVRVHAGRAAAEATHTNLGPLLTPWANILSLHPNDINQIQSRAGGCWRTN